jgi:hypothetical protein
MDLRKEREEGVWRRKFGQRRQEGLSGEQERIGQAKR